jgi:hypothetical protein
MDALDRFLGLVVVGHYWSSHSAIPFRKEHFLNMSIEVVVERMNHLTEEVRAGQEIHDLAYTLSEILGPRFIAITPNTRAFGPVLWQDNQYSACSFDPAGEVVYDDATGHGTVYEGYEVVEVEGVGDSLTLVQVVGDRRVVYHGEYGAAPPCDVDEEAWSRIKPKWDAMMARFDHPYEFVDLTG